MLNFINCSKEDEKITIRIDNNDNVELRFADGKLYYEQGEFVSVNLMPYHIFANKNSQDIDVLNYERDKSYYLLSFVVNDLTNNIAYFVELSLLKKKISIKKIKNQN